MPIVSRPRSSILGPALKNRARSTGSRPGFFLRLWSKTKAKARRLRGGGHVKGIEGGERKEEGHGRGDERGAGAGREEGG